MSLTARRLNLGGGLSVEGASVGVATVGDGVRLALQPAPLATLSGFGGRLAGTLLLRRQGGAASVSADVRLTGAPLAGWGVSQAEGVADVDLSLGTSGESPAGLIANLAGNGEVRLRDGRLLHTAPGAPAALAARLAGDLAGLDAARLTQAAQKELATGSFSVAMAKAPVVVTGGVFRIDPPPLTDGPGSLDGEVSIDVRALRLEAAARLTSAPPPARWKGPPPALMLNWRGSLERFSISRNRLIDQNALKTKSPGALAGQGLPENTPGDLTRTVDVAELQTGLAAIRLDDEMRRVEAWKAEARRLEEAERRRQDQQRLQEQQRQQEQQRLQEEARRRSEEARNAEQRADEPPLPPQRPSGLQRAPDIQGVPGLQPPPARNAPLTLPPTPAPRFN